MNNLKEEICSICNKPKNECFDHDIVRCIDCKRSLERKYCQVAMDIKQIIKCKGDINKFKWRCSKCAYPI